MRPNKPKSSPITKHQKKPNVPGKHKVDNTEVALNSYPGALPWGIDNVIITRVEIA